MARLTATAPNGRVFTRYSEFYTQRRSAVRAAQRALGRGAKAGVDFHTEETAKGWTWLGGPGAGFEAAPAIVPAAAAPEGPMAAHGPLAGLGSPITGLNTSAFDDILRRLAVENGLVVVQAIMQALQVPQRVVER